MSPFSVLTAFPSRSLKDEERVVYLCRWRSTQLQKLLESAFEICSSYHHIYSFNYMSFPINDICLSLKTDVTNAVIMQSRSRWVICLYLLLPTVGLRFSSSPCISFPPNSFKAVYLWCKRDSKQGFSFILRSFSLEFKSGIYVFFSCKSTIKATW